MVRQGGCLPAALPPEGDGGLEQAPLRKLLEERGGASKWRGGQGALRPPSGLRGNGEKVFFLRGWKKSPAYTAQKGQR